MKGNLEANWVTIAGAFDGNIKTNELTVATTAVARGEFLVRDSIVIEPNADFKGQLTRPSDEKPDVQEGAAEGGDSSIAMPSIAEKAEMESAGSSSDGDSPTTPPPPTPLFGGSTRPTPDVRDEDDGPPPRSPFSTSASSHSGSTQATGSPARPQPGPPVSPFSRPDQND